MKTLELRKTYRKRLSYDVRRIFNDFRPIKIQNEKILSLPGKGKTLKKQKSMKQVAAN